MILLEPFRLKNLVLRNRIIMASMGTNLASPEGFVTDELIAYCGERARGGAGLIITELVTIDFPSGNGIEHQLSIDNDKYLPGLRRLVTEVHRHGSKILVQLNHAGHRAKPEFMGMLTPVSASHVPSNIVKVEPRPLTGKEILEITESFGQGARRAREAGFDGIDLHFAHGYLICQFLSSFTNKRSDHYGGSLQNRTRFALEILERCRSEVGQDFLISCKITGHQYVDGGITLKEAKAFCRLLEEKGIDAIQVSGGDPESTHHFPVPPMYRRRGMYLKLAESIKKAVKVPVIAVGRINEVELANRVIETGMADLVAMGRAFLADPHFPNKAQEGKKEEIRACIACNQGCRGRDKKRYLTIGCVLNPLVGREKEKMEIVPAQVSKKVLVIGGGPAGMEAARVLAQKGHDVTLMEAQKGLGGELRTAAKPPGRREFHRVTRWYRWQLKKLGVRLRFGCKVSSDLIRSFAPDAIILATGSLPSVPKIGGLRSKNLVSAKDILNKKSPIGRKTVVIGGGSVGLETADFLATQGKTVTVIEQLSEVGRDLENSTKKTLMERLSKNGVTILTRALPKKMTDNKIVVQCGELKREIPFDAPIVNATGAIPNRHLFNSLKENKGFENLEIYEVGDCVSPRQLRDAILEGYLTAQSI